MELTVGALILAGGKNKRMGGHHKALLTYDGCTFLSHLDRVFDGFHEKLLSTNRPDLAKGTAFLPVTDEVPGQGPLCGVATALGMCKSDALLVMACDMPLVTKEFVLCLKTLAYRYPKASAIAVKDRKGQLHPLCGIYRKSACHTIRKAVAQGEYRVGRVFGTLGGMVVPLEDMGFPDEIVSNINTPAELNSISQLSMKSDTRG